jgi:hypothetical protein
MPMIIKIFLFLFLQQGGKVMDARGGEGSINLGTFFVPSDMALLTIEGDVGVTDQMISVCMMLDNSCEVSRESEVRVVVQFKNISYNNKDRVMERFKAISGNRNIRVYWSDHPTAKL